MSLPPNKEALDVFRKNLDETELEIIEEDLRHQRYGPKDSWKTKEALAKIQKETKLKDDQHKKKVIELKVEGNKMAQKANSIAKWALCLSGLAIIVSILVAIFK